MILGKTTKTEGLCKVQEMPGITKVPPGMAHSKGPGLIAADVREQGRRVSQD